MPLDHYVSQVHLKNFYSPALKDLMHAVRKTDLKYFQCNAESVCRIEDGSSNAFLLKDRVIEDFLKSVEPKYNAALEKLRADKIDKECIHVIAGFAAYVSSCAPAAMRIHSDPLKRSVEATAEILDAQGALPLAPEALGGKTLTQLLKEGTVKVAVDPKFPQAVGISNILDIIATWGNSHWEVLLNKHAESPFFTSDFPTAIEMTDDWRVLNRIIPLAPNLAVRINPDLQLERGKVDRDFSKFSYEILPIKFEQVRELNRLIVRCAEEVVFYRDDLHWVRKFVAKNSKYRIEPTTRKIPQGTGHLIISGQQIAETPEKVS